MNYFFKKCVRKGEERKADGGKKVQEKDLFQDWRRWFNSVCLGNEWEIKEKEQLKMLERKHG